MHGNPNFRDEARPELKIFQMIDPSMSVGEWWIGESIDACKQKMREEYGWTDAELEEHVETPVQLSDATLDKLTFIEEDGEEPVKRTFKEQLEREIAEGGTFPRIFASTEY